MGKDEIRESRLEDLKGYSRFIDELSLGFDHYYVGVTLRVSELDSTAANLLNEILENSPFTEFWEIRLCLNYMMSYTWWPDDAIPALIAVAQQSQNPVTSVGVKMLLWLNNQLGKEGTDWHPDIPEILVVALFWYQMLERQYILGDDPAAPQINYGKNK